jgi:anti-sigma B factor antagonist
MQINTERGAKNNKNYETLFPLHEIDSFKGEELKRYVSKIAENTDVIIIDFADIAYMNSSGLRELIQILKFLRENRRELILTQLSADLKKVFTHTNLDRLFTFHETLQSAYDSIE